MTILEKILGRVRVRVKETERVIVLHKGQVHDILAAGEHMLRGKTGDMELIRHDIGAVAFASPYEKALFDRLPDVAARHLPDDRRPGGGDRARWRNPCRARPERQAGRLA